MTAEDINFKKINNLIITCKNQINDNLNITNNNFENYKTQMNNNLNIINNNFETYKTQINNNLNIINNNFEIYTNKHTCIITILSCTIFILWIIILFLIKTQ